MAPVAAALHGAALRGTALRGAGLHGAALHGAALRGAQLPASQLLMRTSCSPVAAGGFCKLLCDRRLCATGCATGHGLCLGAALKCRAATGIMRHGMVLGPRCYVMARDGGYTVAQVSVSSGNSVRSS